MKKSSTVVEDYFEDVIKNSWTWSKLTPEEQERFVNMSVFDEIKGNDNTRKAWIGTIYESYLIALGYKYNGWR